MKDRYVLVIDSHEGTRNLIGMLLEEKGIGSQNVYFAGTHQEAERLFEKLNGESKRCFVLSDYTIRKEEGSGEHTCTSGLLTRIKNEGHDVVLHSSQAKEKLPAELIKLIDSGVHFVFKSVRYLSSYNEFYSQVIAPALSAV